MSEDKPNEKKKKKKDTEELEKEDPVNKLLYSYPLRTKWKKGAKK